MDALFGHAAEALPPSPALSGEADSLFPEQIPSILGEHACITYYRESGRGPSLSQEQETTQAASPEERVAYKIHLTLDMSSGCGGKIWPAAEVLGAYIASIPQRNACTLAMHPWRGKSVVELGSGTGLVGFLVAQIGCGATTWITDQAPMLPLMEANAALNAASMVDPCYVAELDWGRELPPGVPAKPDVLLLADCVYRESAFQPLVDTMVLLSTPSTDILFAYHKRRKADKRFFTMLKKHFTYTHVEDDDKERRAAYNREGTFLFRMHLAC